MARSPGRKRSRVARLTLRGWFALAAGVVAGVAAYLSGQAELLPLGSLLTALPLLALLYVRLRPLAFRARRIFASPAIAAGTTSIVQLDIVNAAAYRSPAAHWRDTWPWRPFVTVPAQLGPLETGDIRHPGRASVARLQYRLSPARRGLFEIGPLIVDFTDPFGLSDGAIAAGGTSPLVVTPVIVELPEGAVAIAADEGPTRLRQRRAFGGEDDLMTREYRQGDAMRRVHWRASAHHGELMVRQEEQRSHAEARIVLDTRRSGYRDARGAGTVDEPESECFEWAVGFCASLSLYLAERGFIVRVIETGQAVETGQGQLAPIERFDEFLESLAAVQLTDEAGRMSLLGSEARPDRSQGSVFAIVSDADHGTIDRLIAQRPSFDLAVAFLVDPWPSPHFDPLVAAGWICVPVHPGDSIEEAWLAVGAAQEALHGRA